MNVFLGVKFSNKWINVEHWIPWNKSNYDRHLIKVSKQNTRKWSISGNTGNAPLVAMFKAVWGGIQPADGVDECGFQCLNTPGCKSFTIHEESAGQCQLHDNQTLTELATYNSSNLWVKTSELLSILSQWKMYQSSDMFHILILKLCLHFQRSVIAMVSLWGEIIIFCAYIFFVLYNNMLPSNVMTYLGYIINVYF